MGVPLPSSTASNVVLFPSSNVVPFRSPVQSAPAPVQAVSSAGTTISVPTTGAVAASGVLAGVGIIVGAQQIVEQLSDFIERNSIPITDVEAQKDYWKKKAESSPFQYPNPFPPSPASPPPGQKQNNSSGQAADPWDGRSPGPSGYPGSKSGSSRGGTLPSTTDPTKSSSSNGPALPPGYNGPGWYIRSSFQAQVDENGPLGPVEDRLTFVASPGSVASVELGETLNDNLPWANPAGRNIYTIAGNGVRTLYGQVRLSAYHKMLSATVEQISGDPADQPGPGPLPAIAPGAVPSTPPFPSFPVLPPALPLPTPGTAPTPNPLPQPVPAPATNPSLPVQPAPDPGGLPSRGPAPQPGRSPNPGPSPGSQPGQIPLPGFLPLVVPIVGPASQALPSRGTTQRPPPERCNDPCVSGIFDLLSLLASGLLGLGGDNGNGGEESNSLVDLLNQLSTKIDNLAATLGSGNPALTQLLNAISTKVTKVTAQQLPELSAKVDDIGKTVGVGEFPATVPTTLISKEGVPDTTTQVKNLAQFQAWYIKQFDALMGQWEIPLQIEDTDLTKAGNQSAKIKLPNLAEATAEQVGLLLNLTTSINALTNISMRALTEAGSAHKEAAVAHLYGRENAQFLGYEGKETKVKIPMAFKPGGESLEETLTNTEVEIRGWENTDKHDLRFYFHEFLTAAAIIRSVYWKRLDQKGDLTKQVMDFVKEADFLESEEAVTSGNDEFDNFLDRVESGFTGAAGITDPTKPYGREVTRRPRIRKLGDSAKPGGSSGGSLGGT